MNSSGREFFDRGRACLWGEQSQDAVLGRRKLWLIISAHTVIIPTRTRARPCHSPVPDPGKAWHSHESEALVSFPRPCFYHKYLFIQGYTSFQRLSNLLIKTSPAHSAILWVHLSWAVSMHLLICSCPSAVSTACHFLPTPQMLGLDLGSELRQSSPTVMF